MFAKCLLFLGAGTKSNPNTEFPKKAMGSSREGRLVWLWWRGARSQCWSGWKQFRWVWPFPSLSEETLPLSYLHLQSGGWFLCWFTVSVLNLDLSVFCFRTWIWNETAAPKPTVCVSEFSLLFFFCCCCCFKDQFAP